MRTKIAVQLSMQAVTKATCTLQRHTTPALHCYSATTVHPTLGKCLCVDRYQHIQA